MPPAPLFRMLLSSQVVKLFLQEVIVCISHKGIIGVKFHIRSFELALDG